MKKANVGFTIILSLLIIASGCSTKNTPVYQLSVDVDPSEAGTVSPASGEYEEGEQVEITVTPNEHWELEGWQGDHAGSTNPAKIIMTGDKTITALLTKKNYALTVTLNGEGKVQESVVQEKVADYEHQTEVELTAVPAEGWRFVSWAGDIEGTENPQTIVIDQAKIVTANFERRDYPLTVNVEGEGSVAEAVIQSKATEYPYETTVELTANPAEGWVFVGWQGDITGTENPAQLQMTGEKTVTAVFELDYFGLSTSVTGEGVITARLISGDQATDGSYQYGSVVELTAEASSGWVFSDWAGGLAGQANPVEITIGTDNMVAAIFERKEYTITVTQRGEGTITQFLVSGTETTAGYLYESEVQLTADPALGWKFVEWTGDITSTVNPESIVLDTSKTITAVFQEIIYPLDLILDGQGTQSIQVISGAERTGGYQYGTEVEITVTPDAGWNFVYWEGDLQGTDNPIVATITDSLSIIASLDQSPFAAGNGSEMYPYEVSSIDQLNEVRYFTDKHFLQVNTIDASVTSTWNGGAGFIPIGDEYIQFSGLYDGNGYDLTNLFINEQSNNVGLFRTIKNSEVKNVRLINIEIIGQNKTGALAGGVINSAISNIYVSGKITGVEIVGGILGTLESGEVNRLEVDVIVEGLYVLGGIIGSNYENVSILKANGHVSGRENAGGLIGVNYGSIIDSNANVAVETIVLNSGGLIGSNNGTVFNSYSNGKVKSTIRVGGLIGYNSGKVEGSYATGDVYGGIDGLYSWDFHETGGLIGLNYGNVRDSYATGNVISNQFNIGGLIGRNENGSITNVYASGNISAVDRYSIGGLIGSNNGQIENCSYNGNISGGTLIGGIVGINYSDLINCRVNANITGISVVGGIVGSTWESNIINSMFSGEITALSNIGGIFGNSSNTNVSESVSIGVLNGSEIIGGIGGEMKNISNIVNSYSQIFISGNNKVGGVIGMNLENSKIETSYFSGTISGIEDVGSLVGINATGSIIIDSYWDIDSSGFSVSVGTGSSDGTKGLQTSQMVGLFAQNNMPEFDWVNVWITTGSYPILRWQID